MPQHMHTQMRKQCCSENVNCLNNISFFFPADFNKNSEEYKLDRNGIPEEVKIIYLVIFHNSKSLSLIIPGCFRCLLIF